MARAATKWGRCERSEHFGGNTHEERKGARL